MKRYSIRWRLPLSYAAIAFLTALALGAVLYLTLRQYYTGQEREYLSRQALTISRVVSHRLPEDTPLDQLTEYLQAVAFLPQLRIRILDTEGQIVADTGSPDTSSVSVAFAERADNWPRLIALEGGWVFDPDANIVRAEHPWEITKPVNLDELALISQALSAGDGQVTAYMVESPPMTFSIMTGEPNGNTSQGDIWFPVTSSGYGFVVGGEIDVSENPKRSSEEVAVELYNRENELIGYIQLSEGPAIGSEILANVTRGWMFAGGLAVTLAILAGWIASRRITAPLISLTHVTSRMAAGELSVRTEIHRQDELGKLAEAFNSMASRIEDVITTLQRFVSDAAHELHTPLTALRTDLELLAEAHEIIDTKRALSQAVRMQALVDNLLDLSRIESQSRKASHHPIDFRELIRNISTLYASQAEQSGVDFRLDLPESPVIVQGDWVQLERLVSNLFENAIKFTPPGGTVSATARESEGRAILTIHDTGIGIPEDELPHLFERFHRGRNTARYPGSGLGLAIAKAIADAHQGVIRLDNTLPGTMVTVSLPLFPKT